MSATYGLELHLVTPYFHGNNRCGVFLWAVQSSQDCFKQNYGWLISHSFTIHFTTMKNWYLLVFWYLNLNANYLTNKSSLQAERLAHKN